MFNIKTIYSLILIAGIGGGRVIQKRRDVSMWGVKS
jgi:hypothetical protein